MFYNPKKSLASRQMVKKREVMNWGSEIYVQSSATNFSSGDGHTTR
jgi:hypothetical protein